MTKTFVMIADEFILLISSWIRSQAIKSQVDRSATAPPPLSRFQFFPKVNDSFFTFSFLAAFNFEAVMVGQSMSVAVNHCRRHRRRRRRRRRRRCRCGSNALLWTKSSGLTHNCRSAGIKLVMVWEVVMAQVLEYCCWKFWVQIPLDGSAR